jgi:regulator of sigma E protease
MTLVVVIAGLVLLVFLHELGHFSVARAVGMRPRSFYVGFPPALYKVQRNGIEYGIGAIPLGGMVRLPGMNRPAARDLRYFLEPALREDPSLVPAVGAVRRALEAEDYDAARRACFELESELRAAELTPSARRSAGRAVREVEEGTAPEAYWRGATWKRIAVIAAGPLANILVAFVIFFTVFAIAGGPASRPATMVANVTSGEPAAKAGLQPGDRIVAVNGRPERSIGAVSGAIRSSGGRKVQLVVVRDGRRVSLHPEHTIKSGGRRILGFEPEEQTVPYSAGRSVRAAGSNLWSVVTGTGQGLAGLFSSHGRSQLSGPVGIIEVSQQQLRAGWSHYLMVLGFVSMSLALLNLLPLLPLDGGHILFSLIEAVRRRSLAREVYERVSVAGFALVLLLLVIASSNDLSRLSVF